MEEPEKTLVEARREPMVSPTGQNPTSRTAHFLIPTAVSDDSPLPELPSSCFSAVNPSIDPKDLPLAVTFHGWRSRPAGWTAWVEKMAALHEPTWKKAGIHEAIWSSTYQVKKNIDLLFGVAEKWCCDTKSFVFSWGEASITLEDMMILGGYSVLGSPVFLTLENPELEEIEANLERSRIEIVRSKAKKACPRLWMKTFMDTGSEIEHEAFLVFWLSRYVFANAHETIREHVFPIAIHLARGTRIALAPGVLASIYRDLCLLKDAISASAKLGKEEVFTLTLWSPFQLVMAWIWERFVGLRPHPSPVEPGQSRLAMWHDVNRKFDDVGLALDSAGGSFEWRPYVASVENWKCPKFYKENEGWISINARTDKELEAFARCLRASELVGLDCLEQYLPHRVAMQFGIDQDVPGHVGWSIETPDIAWSKYNETINNVKLYVPSRDFKAGVTRRYYEWWKHSMELLEAANKSVEKPKKRGRKSTKKSPMSSSQNNGGNASACTGLHQHRSRGILVSNEEKSEKNDPAQSIKKRKKKKKKNTGTPADSKFSLKSKTIEQILKDDEVAGDDVENESGQTKKRKKKESNKESASPGLHPKRLKRSKTKQNDLSSGTGVLPLRNSRRLMEKSKLDKGNASSPEDRNLTIADMFKSCQNGVRAKTRDKAAQSSPGHSHSLSSTVADNGGFNYFEPLAILAQHAMEDEAMLNGVNKTENIALENQREPSKVQDEALLGRESEKAAEDKHQGNTAGTASQLQNNNGHREVSSSPDDTVGLSLEARISRLERIVAELKAAR